MKPYGGYSWASVITIGVGWLIITIALAYLLARKRWTHKFHEVEDIEGPVLVEVTLDEERPKGEL